MANALNWTKDRNRRLTRRAAAEELEDCRSLGPLPSDATVGLKASLRTIAESIDFDRFNLQTSAHHEAGTISIATTHIPAAD